jgi:AmmeMemoRadiSam system protein B
MPLPRLRMNLDFMPSPFQDRPGLLIRDTLQYSDATLIIPPVLVEALGCYDGEQGELDLRQVLVNLTGDLQVSELEEHLSSTLRQAGFFEDDVYEAMKEQAERAFAESPERIAVHCDGIDSAQMTEFMGEGNDNKIQLSAIAAPHASPGGAWQSYRSAYRTLSPADRDRTFVVLGTSHYGEPDRFGLTRKPFVTPFGTSTTAVGLVDELERLAPQAVKMEDYCHAIEHSIEFQVMFLQHLFGGDVKVLPVLCGSFARSIYRGGMPEDNEDVKRFFGVMGDIAAREGNKLCWVLGVDMAHMGQRYSDRFEAIAGRGLMQQVEQRDRDRMESVVRGDVSGFWSQVQENHDDLKWCGSSPIYTFMKVKPQARGEVLKYEQWNIDEASVVSFASIAFSE